jgi:hypothetical protein
MTPEDRQLLRETAELAKENNKILKGIRRSNRLALLWRIIYWSMIIGLAYGSFIYMEPYIKQLRVTWNSIQEDVGSLKNTASKLPSFLGGQQ